LSDARRLRQHESVADLAFVAEFCIFLYVTHLRSRMMTVTEKNMADYGSYKKIKGKFL